MEDKSTQIRVNQSTIDRLRRLAAEIGVRRGVVYMSDDERINAIMDAAANHQPKPAAKA